MPERIKTFNNYLKDIFKERVHRISLNAGFNCPNLDGKLSTDGCIYCNNKAFSLYAKNQTPLKEQITQSIHFYNANFAIKKFIAYFQSFSNTYADFNSLKIAYDIIKEFPQIVGLFISTRPDCIDEDKIKLISQYKKDYLVWLEYGLQTTNNHLLKKINRNHTYEDFLAALALTRKYDINVGVHIILGLLDQTKDDILQDAINLSQLDIQGIKFHVLHVLKGTNLEQIYKEGKLNLLSKEDYINIVCDFLERTKHDCVILRLVSSADKEYLIAPLWINQRSEVILGINNTLAKRNSYQGYLIKNK